MAVNSDRYLDPSVPLVEYFIPTASSSGEVHKAFTKNCNLPWLQLMYNGDEMEPLKCAITGEHGWIKRSDYGTGEQKNRFRLDFDHIRQLCNDARTSGASLDKTCSPSSLFRSRQLNPAWTGRGYQTVERQIERELDVIEFMTIMPILTEEHSFKSQDSAKTDIVLTCLPKQCWTWVLQNGDNFNKVKEKLNIQHHVLDYDWFIDHMSNITYPNVRDRVIRRILNET